jgi:hypothetical protein
MQGSVPIDADNILERAEGVDGLEGAQSRRNLDELPAEGVEVADHPAPSIRLALAAAGLCGPSFHLTAKRALDRWGWSGVD